MVVLFTVMLWPLHSSIEPFREVRGGFISRVEVNKKSSLSGSESSSFPVRVAINLSSDVLRIVLIELAAVNPGNRVLSLRIHCSPADGSSTRHSYTTFWSGHGNS